MENKICKCCQLNLPIGDFYKNKASKDGLTRSCKKCSYKANTNWYQTNPDKAKKHTANWYKKNPEYSNEYYKANKEKKIAYTKQWKKDKIKTDPYFAHCVRLDTYFGNHIRAIKNSNNFFGCDIIKLTEYLEAQFTPEMNWENHGSYWEVDHIMPRSSFDLNNEDQIKKCFHYTNLQPLVKDENRKKSSKIL